jgi:hypothetical protein
MTFGLNLKGNLHDFFSESAEIYKTVLFKAPQPPRCRKRSQVQIDYFFHILDLFL